MDCDLTDGDRSRCSGHGYYCTSPAVGCICDNDWTGRKFEVSFTDQDKLSQHFSPVLSQVTEILQPKVG